MVFANRERVFLIVILSGGFAESKELLLFCFSCLGLESANGRLFQVRFGETLLRLRSGQAPPARESRSLTGEVSEINSKNSVHSVKKSANGEILIIQKILSILSRPFILRHSH